MRFPRLPRFQSGTTQCQEQSREEKKNDAKKPKKEFILGASLSFQKLSRIWKGFLGIWDLYEIPENAKFLEGVRDLTTTRSASGIPQNIRSGCGVGKENGIRDDKDDRSSGCGIVVTAKDPPFQTLTTVFIRISAHPKGRKS